MKKKLKLLITISMASFAFASNVNAASGTDGISTTASGWQQQTQPLPLMLINAAFSVAGQWFCRVRVSERLFAPVRWQGAA